VSGSLAIRKLFRLAEPRQTAPNLAVSLRGTLVKKIPKKFFPEFGLINRL
jgi:hypothetical protein